LTNGVFLIAVVMNPGCPLAVRFIWCPSEQ
jgi:hypothetical protein